MENPLVSIIVPVYKVERYLSRCIESLIRQTYENLEIILADDHSPDGCGAICDAYAQKDRRISVIHREKNCSAAAARNLGIEIAKGAYFFFADSDDWISFDTIGILLKKMKEYRADCCVGGCVTVLESDDGSLSYQKRKHVPEHCESAYEAMERLLLHESAAWNRLYHRELFSDILFPEGRINDDEVTALRLYAQMERIVFLDHDTYYYRKLKTSEAKRARGRLRSAIRRNRVQALKNPHLGMLLKGFVLIVS